jgi:hypothetical protein
LKRTTVSFRKLEIIIKSIDYHPLNPLKVNQVIQTIAIKIKNQATTRNVRTQQSNKQVSLEKLEQKSLNFINDIVFLNRCKSLNLVPKGTRIKDPWTDIPKSQQLFDTLERKMLTLIKKLTSTS